MTKNTKPTPQQIEAKRHKEREGQASELIGHFKKHAQTLEKHEFFTESRAVNRVVERLSAFTKGVNYLEERRRQMRERRKK